MNCSSNFDQITLLEKSLKMKSLVCFNYSAIVILLFTLHHLNYFLRELITTLITTTTNSPRCDCLDPCYIIFRLNERWFNLVTHLTMLCYVFSTRWWHGVCPTSAMHQATLRRTGRMRLMVQSQLLFLLRNTYSAPAARRSFQSVGTVTYWSISTIAVNRYCYLGCAWLASVPPHRKTARLKHLHVSLSSF